MAISERTLKILFARSGNQCAKPGCSNKIIEDATAADPAAVIGQAAHIIADSDAGPRADPDMPREQRDAEPNLVLLCPTHHVIADRQENTYTVEELTNWKRRHEAAVVAKMDALVPGLTFKELEVVAQEVQMSPHSLAEDFSLTNVRSKMDKNDLTARVEGPMRTGMLGAEIVASYIERTATVDPDFPNRLRSGFVQEYETQRESGLAGDDLFLALQAFASSGSSDLMRQVAGVSVLVHLFRICEVFER